MHQYREIECNLNGVQKTQIMKVKKRVIRDKFMTVIMFMVYAYFLGLSVILEWWCCSMIKNSMTEINTS